MNSLFINSFVGTLYKSTCEDFYSDGQQVSSQKNNENFKKISIDEIADKINGLLNEVNLEAVNDPIQCETIIRSYEKLKQALLKTQKIKRNKIFSIFSSCKRVDAAISNVSMKLNLLCEKRLSNASHKDLFERNKGIQELIHPNQNKLTKSIISIYNLDFDRSSDQIPSLRGQNSLDSLLDTINDMITIINECAGFDPHEKYVMETILTKLTEISRIWIAVYTNPDEIFSLIEEILESIDRPEGVMLPGLFEDHFVIISVEPQEEGMYRFSITNSGEGIQSYHHCKRVSGTGMIFQTTLTFNHVPKEKIADIAFLSQLFKRLPTVGAYNLIMRQLGDYSDSTSRDLEDFRKPQLRNTCATRNIHKWLHQTFYDKGCESAYWLFRRERSLIVSEQLANVSQKVLTIEESKTISNEIRLLKNQSNESEYEFKKLLNQMKKEHTALLKRRRSKLL